MRKLAALQTKDYLTLANAACGVLSIAAAFAGQAWFWLLIPLAALFDWADGRFARITKTVNRLGLELDSLSDVVSFSVSPFFAALVVLGASPLVWIAGVLYVLAGVVRLADFNLQAPAKFYSGLPVPGAALLALVFIFADVAMRAGGSLAALALLVLAFLQVSDLKISKF